MATTRENLQQEDVMTKLYLNVAAGALMAGLIAMPAYALDVSVGGNSSGGTSASASEGDTSANANIGGGGGNVANGIVGTGGNTATFSIGSGSGSLISGSSTGSPVDDNSTSNAAVNLGGLLGGVPGVPGIPGGGGGITPDEVAAAVAAGGGNLAELKLTCAGVLNAPARYEANMVQLCRVLLNL
jgi:hypothetical protein